MERWDLYDNLRNKAGEVIVRGEALPRGRYHLVVHICIFNDQEAMLIQRRQLTKGVYPGFWDVSVGGSALLGETSPQAGEREVLEEIGLRISLADRRPDLSITFPQGFDDFYLIHQNIDLKDLRLQESEVMAVAWAGEEEIQRMVAQGSFIPYSPAFISLLFHLARTGSCLIP